MTWPDGMRIEGAWQQRHRAYYAGEVNTEGKPHGQGVLMWPWGTRYEGEVNAEGEPRGQGVLTLPDGKRYEGRFFKGGVYVVAGRPALRGEVPGWAAGWVAR